MFNEEPMSWYAAYTRPKCEKKVTELFTRKKVDHYYPQVQSVHKAGDRRKITYEPLFPSYVFVQIPESRSWVVRETDNVVNFVYWLGKPAVIPLEEIELIRRFVRDYKDVSIEKFPLQADDASGTVVNASGKVVEISSNRVRADLYSLGCALVATLPPREVIIISGNKAVNGHHY